MFLLENRGQRIPLKYRRWNIWNQKPNHFSVGNADLCLLMKNLFLKRNPQKNAIQKCLLNSHKLAQVILCKFKNMFTFCCCKHFIQNSLPPLKKNIEIQDSSQSFQKFLFETFIRLHFNNKLFQWKVLEYFH